MNIKRIEGGLWRLDVHLCENGRDFRRRITIKGSKREAEKRWNEIYNALASTLSAARSLTVQVETYGALCELYESVTEPMQSMRTVYGQLKTGLKDAPLEGFILHFDRYRALLMDTISRRTGEKMSPYTVNHAVRIARILCNFAVRRGLMNRNPLSGYEMLHEPPRESILSPAEEGRLLHCLQDSAIFYEQDVSGIFTPKRRDDEESRQSYLYWPIRFALQNPIRAGDLFSLALGNYDALNRRVHFVAEKTRRKNPRETFLVMIDDEMHNYFVSLPAECPFLFPRNENGHYSQIRNNIKRPWKDALDRAGIKDYRLHDTRHNGYSFYVNAGLSDRDILDLNVTRSTAMITRYANSSVEQVMDRIKAKSAFFGNHGQSQAISLRATN